MLKMSKEAESGQYVSTGKSFTKPYIPVVTNLSSKLVDLAKTSPKLADYLKGKGRDSPPGNSEWETFATTKLADTLARERTSFGHAAKPDEEPEDSKEEGADLG